MNYLRLEKLKLFAIVLPLTIIGMKQDDAPANADINPLIASLISQNKEIIKETQESLQFHRHVASDNIKQASQYASSDPEYAKKLHEKANYDMQRVNEIERKIEAENSIKLNILNQAQDYAANKQKYQDESQERIIKHKNEIEAAAKASLDKFKYAFSKEVMTNFGLVAAGLIITYFVAKYGVPKLIDYISGKPVLAQQTSLLTFTEKLSLWFYGNKPERKLEEVIFEPKLASKIRHISDSISHTVENNDYFDNVLLYGQPGTGKTLAAQTIALNSRLDYIYFAASSLDQFSQEESLQKLTQLFEFAKNSNKKLMIIIDEAEMLLANRDKELSEKSRKLLTHILAYTGTESKNFIIFFLTNRPQDLDPAVLNRCGIKLNVGIPPFEQRKDILKLYINKILVKAAEVKKESIFKKLKNRLVSTKNTKPIIIPNDLINEQLIDELATKTDGFVGRDLSKTVRSILSYARVAPERTLTKEIIDIVMHQKLEEKQEEKEGFKKSNQLTTAA